MLAGYQRMGVGVDPQFLSARHETVASIQHTTILARRQVADGTEEDPGWGQNSILARLERFDKEGPTAIDQIKGVPIAPAHVPTAGRLVPPLG